MKIAFIAPFGLGQKTTVWARTLPLAKELVTLGHEVSIIIPPWDTPTDSGKDWHDEGVALVNVSLRGGLPFIVFRILHEVRKFQPDIVHIVKPRAHAGIVQWLLWQMRRWNVAQFAIRNSQFAMLLDLDDWEQAWAEINHYPWLVAKFLAWQEEWGIRHADGITAASRWLQARAGEYTPNTPVLYLPNGVELQGMGEGKKGRREEGEKGNSNSRFTIFYLTRYVEVEPEWLVRFSASLHASLPNAQLLIAGEPLQPGRDKLFQSALDLQPSAYEQEKPTTDSTQLAISFLGKVTPQQISELYASVNCAIFPSAPTILQQAKCSVRLATTLLNGVPVIASAVGEQANYGSDGAALLVSATATPEEFAKAVVDLLLDGAAQQEMIENAQSHLAENYQWQQLGKKLESWYENISM